ncbi:MAG: FecR family protein [Chitinophagaceae bacterium]|nr:FecR family protein [Chitinophagaceae bacterium]MCW5925487.1 FecR family protein [Chitinophagaceae bacterium]
MNNDRFIELLAKKKSGALTLPEKREMDAYLEENADDAIIASMVDEIFDVNFNFDHKYNRESLKAPLNSLNERIERSTMPPPRSYNLRFWSKVAAAVIAIFSIAYFVFVDSGKNGPAINSSNIVSTKKGSKSNIVLPDGTVVWINADTRLSYNENTWEKIREVELMGEAYFDVVKDTKKPFIVHTKVMDIKVTGTAFNVRAYPNEKNSETTLLRGSVEVYLKKKKGEKITLVNNEKLVVQNNYAQDVISSNTTNDINEAAIQLLTIKVDPVDSTAKETQWIKSKLIFDNESFEDIIPVLERRFNTKIELQRKIVTDRKFSGTFDDDSLKDVLESFRFSIGFNYTIYEDKVLIY